MNLRRFGWAVVILSTAVLLLILYTNRQKAQRKADQGQNAATAAATSPAPAAETQPVAPSPAAPAAPVATAADPAPAPATATTASANAPDAPSGTGEWRITEEANPRVFPIGSLDLKKTGYTFRVETRSRGAAINSVKLSAHFATVEDKRLHDRKPDQYDAIRAKNPRVYRGHYSLLNPVGSSGRRYLPLATRSISITVPGRKEPVYYRLDNKPWWRVPPTPADRTDESESIRFSWTLLRNANHADSGKKPDYRKFLTVYKTYTVRRKDYRIGVSLEVENHSLLELKVSLDQSGPVGIPREDLRGDSRKFFYAKLRNEGQKIQPSSHGRGDLGKMELAKTEDVGTSFAGEPVLWFGETNKFFGSIMYLVPREEGRLQAPAYQARFYYAAIEENPTSRTFLTGVRIPELTVVAGRSAKVAFDLFAGPKRRGMFVNAADEYYCDRYDKLEYVKMIDFGGCSFCTFNWLSLKMMWLLQKLSWVARGNFGVAIILLVILVRLCLHPLTKKGQVSMMKMQKLAPAMKKLEEKYKDDKEALNKEKMRLFKEGGAGQFLGCLPMFLQMPIWIALWTGINAAIELRHSAFLPVWITDLAAPDALVTWPVIIVPLLGWKITSLNLLPILLTFAMYIQAKLNPQMTGQTATATPEAQKQQKMMRVMMPVMMLLIFYKAPSGLTLYIMASTFFGVAEQFVIRKHIREKEAAEAAIETTVRVSGKGPRASRPKKPKGPFWTKQ